MNEIIFKIIYVGIWLIFIAIRVPFEKKYRLKQKLKTIDPNKEKKLIILLTLGLLLVPLIWVFTSLFDNINIYLPVWLRFSGVVLSFLSLYYFFVIHKTLGENWSPTLEIIKGHQLIQIGVYKRIRHPMYSQMLIWAIAQCLIISNYIAGFSGLIVWVVFYFIRVPKEEKMMTDYFGEEYMKYKRQTGSILPSTRNSDLLN